jgi:riboflavin synthase
MFTGIIEGLGTVVEAKPTAAAYRLRVETALAGELSPGDSLAVNGVCLTMTHTDGGEIHADVGPETARVTTLGSLEPGSVVNLERPVKFDGRLGGHLVLGHVDGVGSVEDIQPDSECSWITIAFPAGLAAYFIRKGSVAVDGVSLTIAGLGERRFDVQIVPFTCSATTLGRMRPGDKVNLECDMIGKYVVRALELSGQSSARTGWNHASETEDR